jgi:large repetitive protein
MRKSLLSPEKTKAKHIFLNTLKVFAFGFMLMFASEVAASIVEKSISPYGTGATLENQDVLPICDFELALDCSAISTITLECSQPTDPEFTGYPSISVEPTGQDCPVVGDLQWSDDVQPGCPTTILRTWSISDSDGNEASCVQTIIIVDTTAPTFNEEIADIHIQCLEDVPPFVECTATDACDDDVQVWSFQSSSLFGEETCVLTTAYGIGTDWSVWLANLPGASDYYHFTPGGGTMQIYNDGSALITGTVVSSNNVNHIFNVFIRLENKRNWAEWSALGRDYKDDALLAGNNYLDWDYFELDGENSFLVGAGDFAGSILNLTHMPANFFYGFQCGVAANNKNANFGMSGWFFYNGWLNGAAVSGVGDVNVDKECEPNYQVNECEYVIQRFWFAIDNCGNVASAEQTITVADTIAPEFTMVPEDLFFDCIADVPAADVSQLEAEDNCDDAVIITYEGDFQTGGDCNAIIVRTYEAIDSCGNFVKHFQTITVVDDEAPVLVGVPADAAYSCEDEIPAPADVTATDNCTDDVVVSFNETIIPGDCPQSYVIERTWSATDNCDNTVSATQYITVSDELAPVITECPADASYDCLADVPAADASLVSATDNCGNVTIVLFSEVTDGDECEGTIVRTYRATDECGNFADCVQVINYNDNVAPVFNNPPVSMYVDCANIPAPEEVIATDNCSEVTITFSELFGSGGCVGVIIRTYIATDACGNTAIHEQYITLVDTVAPVLNDLPADATYECDEVIPAPADVTATDNCDSAVMVEFSETMEAGDCPQEYTIFRTWSAIDTCENSVSYTQIINIVDTTAPVFNMEDTEITVSCDSQIQIPSPTATDNCDENPTITAASSISQGDCANEWTESYSWTATDNCGNSSTVTFTVNYIDEEAPAFTFVPETISVECDAEVPVTSAQATDNCGDVTITYADSDLMIDNCAGFYIRTFTAVDECGNIATATQIIDLIDTTAPVITACPADASYDCLADVPAPNTSLVSATDNCSDVSIALLSEVTDGDECAGTIIRTYRATDECGNFTDCVQVISYNDNVAPVFNNPPVSMYVDCANIPAPESVTATDNCSEVTITYTQFMASGGCIGVIVRTFTATDACGNTATHEQYITLVDTVAPVLANLPADATYECDEEVPAPADVTATDNCDASVIVEFSETTEDGDCPQEYTIIRTWTATDTCENSVSYTQVITITDNTAPVFVWVPEDLTVQCPDDVPAPAELVATDNCDDNVTISFEELEPVEASASISTAIGEGYALSIPTFIPGSQNYAFASDGTFTQFVDGTARLQGSVYSTTYPEKGWNVDIYLKNKAGWDQWNATGGIYVDDNNLVNNDEFINWDFYVIDADQSILTGLGDYDGFYLNISQAAQPLNTGFQVGEVANNRNTNWGMYTRFYTNGFFDGQNVLGWGNIFFDGVQGPELYNECSYDIVRVWTATDACGNSTSVSQTIHVEDTIAPVFTMVPDDLFFACIDDVPAADTSLLDAEDNCSDVTITHEGDLQTGDDCNAVIIRTYEAIDECGNFVKHFQTITVVDNVAPVFTFVPGTIDVECSDEIPVTSAQATDNCGAPMVTYTDSDLMEDECAGYIVRTFTATDDCGNTATATQIINLIDTTAPTFDNAPANTTASCDNIPAIEPVTASDNCGAADVVVEENMLDEGCAGTVQRIFTATDACGNTTIHEQLITLIDTIAPTLHNVPSDETILCSDEDFFSQIMGSPMGSLANGNNLTYYPTTGIINTTPPIGVFNDAAPGFPSGSFAANGQTATQIIFTPQQLFGYDITIADIASMSYYTKRAVTATPPVEYLNWYLGMFTTPDGIDDDGTWFGRQLNFEPNFSVNVNAPANQWVKYSTDEGTNRMRVFDPYRGLTQLVYGTFQDPFWNTITSGDVTWNSYNPAYAAGTFNYTEETILLFTIGTGSAWASIFEGQVDGFRIILTNGDEATINFEPQPVDGGDDDVTATDNCDEDVDVIMSQVIIPGECPQQFTIERTWTATDDCGNTTSATQVISVQAVAPEISGEDMTLTASCSEEALLPEFTVTDACEENVPLVLEIDSIAGNCPNEWTEIYTWTATNSCGLSAQRVVTVIYVDNEAPVLTSVPEDMFFECIEDVPAADASNLAAVDNCGDVTIIHLGDTQEGDDCDAVISRTYRASDACGNFTDHVQLIHVADTLAPVWDAIAADFTTTCDDVPPPVDCYATDNCSGIAAGFSEVIEEGCPTIITRTWTATDDCGNMAVQTQIITVIDEVAPVIANCPADASYDCLADVPAADISLITATDNCNDVVITLHSEITDGDDCAGTIIRTYRATDVCGNYSECVQVIEYNDNIAPTFVNPPANGFVNCDEIPSVDSVIAIDNCDTDVTVTMTQLYLSGGCAGVFERTWTATDNCGNSTVHIQYITLIDNVAPVLNNLPENASYECDEEIPAPADVFATDNCFEDEITLEFEEWTENGDCPNSYTIYRMWTAIDVCDNSTSYTQTINVSDNTAPVFDVQLQNITVACDQVPAAEECTATDNCSELIVYGFSEVVTEGCPYTITRTWTATDECGNTATQTQVITVVDEVAPVLSMYPADATVSCDNIPAAPAITATDNCDDDLNVSFVQSAFEGCSGQFTRTWSVTDWCNNTTTHVQTITVVDEVAPWFNQSVEDATVECDAIPSVPQVSASDNCDLNVAIAYNEQIVDGDCDGNYTIIRTWTATDDCNNSSTLVQTITVEDNTAPVFVDVPADATYTCDDEIPALEDCIAIDNCSGNITYTSVEYIEGYTGEDGLRECTLTTPFNVIGQPWALWLPNSIGEPQYYYLSEAGGQFTELPNGRAHLTGVAYAHNNPNKRWIIDVYFKDRADWTTWSALGRSYKDDAMVAGNLFETWDYYVMNADSAVLTGDGLYAGANLNLSHMPASLYFGFQVGQAANNRNAADGMSGWFFYNGNWNNANVNGVGDFGFESDCPECDYTITRIWTATDDCGNEAMAVQVITVNDNDSEIEGGITEQQIGRDSGVLLAAWPNPTAHKATINFSVPFGGNVVLEVFNMDGKLIQTLYQGEVMANQEYFFDLNAQSLSSGIYLYKLTTDSASYIDKLMIVK